MDAPVLLGKISDVATGDINTGYAFIHALVSTDAVYGKADVYDRPYGSIQLRVEPGESGVLVSVQDLQEATQRATENADMMMGDSQRSAQSRARQVIRYATEISGTAPKQMRVT